MGALPQGQPSSDNKTKKSPEKKGRRKGITMEVRIWPVPELGDAVIFEPLALFMTFLFNETGHPLELFRLVFIGPRHYRSFQ